MGILLSKPEAAEMFSRWTDTYDVYAPVRKEGEGCFSDTDVIRYDRVTSLDDIVWDKKSDYSFKETLLHINETLFYYTEDQTLVPKGPERDILIFLRACDLHGVKRLDEIYLRNGYEDFYYARIRERAHFILMGCESTCESGFCVSMGTNRAENYDGYLKLDGDRVCADFPWEELAKLAPEGIKADVTPDYVTENKEKVTLPRNLSNATFENEIWKEYGERCIGCGRCNFVCPTCTCFTMQDIFYRDNPKAGERRRVWASCQVDGYTDMAGGLGYRKTQGERMRFKVMHKIYDYEKRFGYPMCVGCGRCDDGCPEYISYSNCINRLAKEESEQ
ncbi:MAG TPA: anaerobic sulfite reductase subunit AsrA [Candidatus Bariatricus faecipullorum]|nr:anaerobic sulfite reductase subunit AsrA [Candidatus Bariatricus faecipullorum]